MPPTPKVILKSGREKPVQRHHPWIFSGAVERVQGKPSPGALVAVHSHTGDFLAWGHYSPQSQIRIRLVSWNEQTDPESRDFWRERLEGALEGRRPLVADNMTTACRLVHGESDGFPGLIVDQYGDTLVAQYLTVGMEVRRELINGVLAWMLQPRSFYERSDAEVRQKEGLSPRTGLVDGEDPPEYIEIQENGLGFLVDIREGHKTGFYLDQRENRERLRQAVKRRVDLGEPPRVLNVFSYTGGFGIYAVAAGAASLTNVDSSKQALQLGWQNLSHNGFARAATKDIEGDAFEVLRTMREQGYKFEIIVLDPPKFANSKRDVKRAARGYKDINMQALHLLERNGLLFTFSCSGAVSADLFQKIIFSAAHDAGVDAQIIGRMTQGADHPTALTLPESDYLKGLICRVVR